MRVAMVILSVAGALGMVRKSLKKRLEKLEIRQSRDHPNYSIFLGRLEYSEESWKPEETCCQILGNSH